MAGRLQLDRVRTEVERFKAMLQMLAEGGEDLAERDALPG